jgi:transposase
MEEALLEGAADIFDKGQKSRKQTETQVDELYRRIGQLKVGRDFLAKGLSRIK